MLLHGAQQVGGICCNLAKLGQFADNSQSGFQKDLTYGPDRAQAILPTCQVWSLLGRAMQRRSIFKLYHDEFSGYNLSIFRQDLLAGLTVAAVALPLALAFGVASGATAAAGLVTAIISGLLIGLLSGAPYQISGPTGLSLIHISEPTRPY